jgi:DNA-binding LacI/PurR family transcriptional regulator
MRKSAAVLRREQITAELASRLDKGVYPEGSFLPPERQLAEEFGVSRPTLRKSLAPLLKAGRLVNQQGVGTRVGSKGVDASSAPTVRDGWRIIALLLPDVTNRFYIELTEAVEYHALQRGYQLLLCNSRHQLAVEETHLRQLAQRRVDGVILAHDPHLAFPTAMALLREAGIPFVHLFSSPAHALADTVMVDERDGAAQVMRYLFSLGHRYIAFCQPVAGENPHPRERAYRELMARQQCPVLPHFVLSYRDLEDAACAAALERVLETRPAPTAFFAGNDRVALVLLKHLSMMGIEVPAEVSVVGFDNLRFTEHLPVPLTTVDQPKREMGRRAVELLVERMESKQDLAPRTEVFRPHLVIRSSCAIAPQHERPFALAVR